MLACLLLNHESRFISSKLKSRTHSNVRMKQIERERTKLRSKLKLTSVRKKKMWQILVWDGLKVRHASNLG